MLLSLAGTLLYRLQLALARREGRPALPWWRAWLGMVVRRAREIIVRRWDPVIRMPVGAHLLQLPLSSQLPLYLRESDTYDRVLPRIAAALRATVPEVRMIDVGAFVGDSAVLVADLVPDARFLCIEGNRRVFPLLESNLKRLGIHATCERSYCGEGDGGLAIALESEGDRGRLYTPRSFRRSTPGVSHEARLVSLDTVIATYGEFRDASLLKTDTEGYELQVLRGAREYLIRARPVLFLEYHPQLLREAHDDPRGLAPLLAAAGYRRATAYTNLGRRFAALDLLEPGAVAALEDHIDAREIHYFDLLVAPPEREGMLSAV